MNNRPLPSGWRMARVGDILKIRNGYAFKSSDYKTEGVPLIRQSNLGEQTVDVTEAKRVDPKFINELPNFIVREGDLLIGMSGSIGKVARYEHSTPALQNQRTGLLQVKPDNDLRFANFVLRYVEPQIAAEAKGVAVQNVSASDIEDCIFPLPPPSEQRRIVAEIEKQFTRLDAGIAALKRVQANLKRYRAAVLKAACEGKLVPTEAELAKKDGTPDFESGASLRDRILAKRRKEWRGRGKYKEPDAVNAADAPFLPKGWACASLAELALHITDGTHKTPTYVDKGVAFISAKDIVDFRISFATCRYIPATEHETLSLRCGVKRGNVLITKSGTIGRVATVETDERFSLFESVANVPVLPPVQPKFIVIAAFVAIAGAFGVANQKGVAVRHLHLEDLRRVPIPLPPVAEQKRIVAEVDSRLTTVQQLEATVLANLSRAERLRHSILARAFLHNNGLANTA